MQSRSITNITRARAGGFLHKDSMGNEGTSEELEQALEGLNGTS